MKFIIGLGNPTTQYVGTRHNIGFDAVTRLADEHRISVTEKKQPEPVLPPGCFFSF